METKKASRALLMIVSGPAGSGKTTLCDRMCDTYSNIERVITSTTRKPREGEIDGVDYHFLSKEVFEDKINADEFYEYAHVHSNYYGSLKSVINDKLNKGADLLLNIDIQGAAAFTKTAKVDKLLNERLLTIFISASIEELRSRLLNRNTDHSEEIERRLKVAELEMKEAKNFHHCVESKSMENDFLCLKNIYEQRKQSHPS